MIATERLYPIRRPLAAVFAGASVAWWAHRARWRRVQVAAVLTDDCSPRKRVLNRRARPKALNGLVPAVGRHRRDQTHDASACAALQAASMAWVCAMVGRPAAISIQAHAASIYACRVLLLPRSKKVSWQNIGSTE